MNKIAKRIVISACPGRAGVYYIVDDQVDIIRKYLRRHGVGFSVRAVYAVWIDTDCAAYHGDPVTLPWVSVDCNRSIFASVGTWAPPFHITHIQPM